MSVGKRFSRKSLAPLTALAMFIALVPLGGTALAAGTIDATPETATVQTGVNNVITVGDPGHVPGDEIDAEIDCLTNCSGVSYTAGPSSTAGGPTSPFDAGVENDQTAGAADDTRTTPELSCDIDGGGTTCTVSYTRNTPGSDLVAFWHDDDGNNANNDTESDATEGLCGGNAGDEAGCTPVQAGSQTDPDDTDVVRVDWFQALPLNATLDCDNDNAPGDTPGEPASDASTVAAGGSQLWTCLLWNDNGQGGGTAGNGIQDGGEQGVSGVRIDLEISGANDPDNLGFAAGTNVTADVNDAITTGADGRGTYTKTATDNEGGAALLCFWADGDADTEFANATAGVAADGEECDDEGVAPFISGAGSDADADTTDVVSQTWGGGQAAALDAEPENDANARNGTHTVEILVVDALGAPVAGVPVDVSIDPGSRNAALGLIGDHVLTNAQGRATVTYTDGGAAITPGTFQTDTITVCASAASGANSCVAGAEAATAPEFADMVDVILKDWYNTVPATGDLRLDADANPKYQVAACETEDFDATDTQSINTVNVLCADIRDANGVEIAGKSVTLTITGPGFFFRDRNQDGVFNSPPEENLGKSITVNADADGDVFAPMTSLEVGQSTVTATSDAQSVSVTKNWVGQPPRNITCTPKTQSNTAGGTVTLTCNVRDRFTQPVFDATVGLIESGPGRTTQNRCGAPFFGPYADCDVTDQQGNVDFALTSGAGEIGTQTLIGEILLWGTNVIANCNPVGPLVGPGGQNCGDGDNTGTGDPASDVDDPCDQPANRVSTEEGGGGDNAPAPPGTSFTAGNCEDTVNVQHVLPTVTENECNDQKDNDNDGRVDFNDPGCDFSGGQTESPEPQCFDKVDNDGDGKIDFGTGENNDPGCTDESDNDESNVLKTKRISTEIRPDDTHNSPFTGTVDSDKRKCEKKRKVTVRKAGGRKIGSDKTNRFGLYRVGHNRPHGDGRFVHKVKKKTFTNKAGRRIICLAARASQTI